MKLLIFLFSFIRIVSFTGCNTAESSNTEKLEKEVTRLEQEVAEYLERISGLIQQIEHYELKEEVLAWIFLNENVFFDD